MFSSALGLKSIDKIFGFLFGFLKVTIILLVLFIYNLDFLKSKKWWNDSYCSEYTTLFYETLYESFPSIKYREFELIEKDNLKVEL